MGKIKHEGIIQHIDEQGVQVRITQMAACASCKVASQCQMADKKEKIVEVADPDRARLSVGDSVVVSTEETMGFRAVFLAFILPFFVLVGVLVAVLAVTHNEAWAALAGIAALFPYYALLFLKRETLRQKFQFHIETNQ